MEIILHAHHADVTDTLRARAETAVRQLAARLSRAAHALIRFVGDGPTRRVEIVLRDTRHRELVAHADARAFAPALTTAVQRLESQIARSRRPHRVRRPGDHAG